MLCLTLRNGDLIQIGDAVAKVKCNGKVRLFIEAPKSVAIRRGDLLPFPDQAKPENRRKAS